MTVTNTGYKSVFSMSGEEYREFIRSIENPPAPNERLNALMAEPSPWEDSDHPAPLVGTAESP